MKIGMAYPSIIGYSKNHFFFLRKTEVGKEQKKGKKRQKQVESFTQAPGTSAMQNQTKAE